MASKVAFPFVPASKFHAGKEAQFKATLATHQSIDELNVELEAGNKRTEDAIRDLGKVFEKRSDRDAKDAEVLAEPLRRIADALGSLGGVAQDFVRRDTLRETNYATALFGAGVDVTGDIVGRTIPGRWLNDAGYTKLGDIIPKGKPTDKGRADFVTRMTAIAGNYSGLPPLMSPADLGLFYELVPSTLKAIEDSQVP